MDANATVVEADCLAAQAVTTDLGYNIVRAAQLALGLAVSGLQLKVVHYYKRHRVTLHPNLVAILAAIFGVTALLVWAWMATSVRSFYLALSRSSPCDCLTPVWLVYALRMPFYAYIIASPLFYFATTAERMRATVFVKNYEQEGRTFGVVCVGASFLVTVSLCYYIYRSSIVDSAFQRPMAYVMLSSHYNSDAIFYAHFPFLLLAFCISIVDYVLIRLNRRIKVDITVENYSLSRNYQAIENLLTMRVIFPLDFSYTVAFSIFIVLSGYIRAEKSSLGELAYKRIYDAISLVLFLHAILTLLVYQYFLGERVKAKQKAATEAKTKGIAAIRTVQVNTYFRNLHAQWDRGENP